MMVNRFTKTQTETGEEFSLTDPDGNEIFWAEVATKTAAGERSGLALFAAGIPPGNDELDEHVSVYTDAWVLEEFAMALLSALRGV
jgi:hypothetical protein